MAEALKPPWQPKVLSGTEITAAFLQISRYLLYVKLKRRTDMQRTKHTAEFKAGDVKQVKDKGHTMVDVAARLGLSKGLLTALPRGTCEHCKLS